MGTMLALTLWHGLPTRLVTFVRLPMIDRRSFGTYQPFLSPSMVSLQNNSFNFLLIAVVDPILAYTAEAPVNQLQWSVVHPDWIGIVFGQSLQILRV